MVDRKGKAVMQVVIFGAGKIAEALHSYLVGDSNISVVGFTCDRAFATANEFRGIPLVPFDEVEISFPPATHAMLVAVGYQDLNDLRAKRCRQACEKGYRLISWLSPRAHVAHGCTVGTNTVVMDGAV